MTDYETIYDDAYTESCCTNNTGPLLHLGPRTIDHDAGLAAVVAAAKAEALEGFAALLRERYPDDVFKPMLDRDHRSVNDAMAGRRPNTIVTRDRVSADMMRRAAAQADEQADEIRKEATQ